MEVLHLAVILANIVMGFRLYATQILVPAMAPDSRAARRAKREGRVSEA